MSDAADAYFMKHGPAELLAWAKAAIDADEADARAVLNAPHANYSERWSLPASATLDVGDDVVFMGDALIARRVVRWDPARVLAECAAKRAMLAVLADLYDQPVGQGYVDDQLCAFVQPWAGREGWRDEWRTP